jgi:hypothetical protein
MKTFKILATSEMIGISTIVIGVCLGKGAVWGAGIAVVVVTYACAYKFFKTGKII